MTKGLSGGGLGLLFDPLASLWRHRQLYRRLLNRDILATVRGSVLGLAWVVLIPLILVTIYTFIFGVVLSSTWSAPTSTPLEVPLIFFAGLGLFGFFMEVISRSPAAVRDNDVYVKKVVFPLDMLAWVLVGTSLFKYLINFALLLFFLLLLTGGIPAKVLLVPVLLLPFLIMTLGIAWMFAAIGTYVRDLTHFIQALGPIILFGSPVFYAVQQVPESFRWIYMLNPLSFILESLRSLLFFDTMFSFLGLAVYTLVAIIVYATGFAFFQRLRPGFADVV